MSLLHSLHLLAQPPALPLFSFPLPFCEHKCGTHCAYKLVPGPWKGRPEDPPHSSFPVVSAVPLVMTLSHSLGGLFTPDHPTRFLLPSYQHLPHCLPRHITHIDHLCRLANIAHVYRVFLPCHPCCIYCLAHVCCVFCFAHISHCLCSTIAHTAITTTPSEHLTLYSPLPLCCPCPLLPLRNTSHRCHHHSRLFLHTSSPACLAAAFHSLCFHPHPYIPSAICLYNRAIDAANICLVPMRNPPKPSRSQPGHITGPPRCSQRHSYTHLSLLRALQLDQHHLCHVTKSQAQASPSKHDDFSHVNDDYALLSQKCQPTALHILPLCPPQAEELVFPVPPTSLHPRGTGSNATHNVHANACPTSPIFMLPQQHKSAL